MRMIIPIIFMVVFLGVFTTGARAAWWNNTYGYRQNATLKYNETNSISPVGILANSTTFINTANLIADAKMDNACSDMRFVNGTNDIIPYEVESGCNSPNTVIWMQNPVSAANNTVLSMYYGATGAGYGNNTKLVWDNYYHSVIHYKENTGATASTSASTYSGSLNGNYYWMPGVFGTGMKFGSTTADYINLGNPSLGASWTLETWLNFSAYPSGGSSEIMTMNGGASEFEFYMSDGGTDLRTYFWRPAGTRASTVCTMKINLNQWYYVVLVEDNGALNIFINGTRCAANSQGDSPTAYDVKVAGGGFWKNGAMMLDETRLSSIARSDGYMRKVWQDYLNYTQFTNEETPVVNTAPRWSNNQSYINGTGNVSFFNITWLDLNSNLDTVIFESNYTGTAYNYTNYTAFGNGIFNYNTTIGTSGIYYWMSYANDTTGLWNVTTPWYFNISAPAPPPPGATDYGKWCLRLDDLLTYCQANATRYLLLYAKDYGELIEI